MIATDDFTLTPAVAEARNALKRARKALDVSLQSNEFPRSFVFLGVRRHPVSGSPVRDVIAVDIEAPIRADSQEKVAVNLRKFAAQTRAAWAVVMLPGAAMVMGTGDRAVVMFIVEVEHHPAETFAALIELREGKPVVVDFAPADHGGELAPLCRLLQGTTDRLN